MKYLKIIFLIILMGAFKLFSIIPMYYGARSLSLGFSGSAYNYDINSVLLNPGLLSGYGYFVSGYQMQNEFFSYKGFSETIEDIKKYDLSGFDFLDMNDKEYLHGKLEELFKSKHGMYGFNSKIFGSAFKRYGFAVSFVNLAIINPVRTTELDKSTTSLTSADIENLNLNFINLSYKQYSISYSLDFSKEISAGVTVHYLAGKISQFSLSIADTFFAEGMSEKDYLEYGWGEPDKNFGKFVFDFSLSTSLGPMFRLSLILKNYKNPKIETGTGEIELVQRIVGAVSFSPDQKTGIYMDLDLTKGDLYYNGEKVQPISLGVERSFFQGRLFFRMGFMSDLTEKYLLGRDAKLLYGLGVGIYINKVLIDAALGIGNDGKVRSFAVSGFFIVR